MYDPKVTFFRGCAKFHLVAFFKIQDGCRINNKKNENNHIRGRIHPIKIKFGSISKFYSLKNLLEIFILWSKHCIAVKYKMAAKNKRTLNICFTDLKLGFLPLWFLIWGIYSSPQYCGFILAFQYKPIWLLRGLLRDPIWPPKSLNPYRLFPLFRGKCTPYFQTSGM